MIEEGDLVEIDVDAAFRIGIKRKGIQKMPLDDFGIVVHKDGDKDGGFTPIVKVYWQNKLKIEEYPLDLIKLIAKGK